jgi:hypothetical protein
MRIEGAGGQRFTVEQVLDREGIRNYGVRHLGEQNRVLVCSFSDAQGHAFWQLFFTPAFLLQVRDAIGRILDDGKQPQVNVHLQLVQPAPPAPL